MTNPSTQQPHTIGDPNRFVIDSRGNVQWYDTFTLCLERADGVIDLALSYERDRGEQPGIRLGTVTAALQRAQQELDDIRHVLHQWRDAGLPEEHESDAAASSEGKTITPLSNAANLDMINNVQTRTLRAKASADLLTTYFQNISQPLSEILDDTIEVALDSIIRELHAINQGVDTIGEPERVQSDDVCEHIEHARAMADLLLAYFQKVSQALANVHYETVEASLAGIIRELDAIQQLVSPEDDAEVQS